MVYLLEEVAPTEVDQVLYMSLHRVRLRRSLV
jgi:hypothetical protein